MQLLFCEDEYLTRIGVMQTIPWEEIGITHVDCAKNGQEGMEMLSTHPDILLTDIRMPFVSGLDIATHLKEMDPYSEVIIMSSYSDKEYLKNLKARSPAAGRTSACRPGRSSSLRQSTLPVSPTRTPPPFPRPRALCSEKSATGMRI